MRGEDPGCNQRKRSQRGSERGRIASPFSLSRARIPLLCRLPTVDTVPYSSAGGYDSYAAGGVSRVTFRSLKRHFPPTLTSLSS